MHPSLSAQEKILATLVFFLVWGRRFELVGSETRVEAGAETSGRASDESPGEIHPPTLDE